MILDRESAQHRKFVWQLAVTAAILLCTSALANGYVEPNPIQVNMVIAGALYAFLSSCSYGMLVRLMSGNTALAWQIELLLAVLLLAIKLALLGLFIFEVVPLGPTWVWSAFLGFSSLLIAAVWHAIQS